MIDQVYWHWHDTACAQKRLMSALVAWHEGDPMGLADLRNLAKRSMTPATFREQMIDRYGSWRAYLKECDQ